MHYICGNIWKTVQDASHCYYRLVIRNDTNACRTAETPMTLIDLQVHSPTASLSNCDFLYSCSAIDKISSEIGRRAVPVQYSRLNIQTALVT